MELIGNWWVGMGRVYIIGGWGWGGFSGLSVWWHRYGRTRPYRDNRVGMGRFFVLTVLAGAITRLIFIGND